MPFHLPIVNQEVPSRELDDEDLLRVGDLARISGKTVRAIHHYEKIGLLQPHRRSKGGYRLYAPDAVKRVRWINKLHDMNMSLSEIQKILALWEQAPSAPGAMNQLRGVYRDKLDEVRSQIARLSALEHELTSSLGYLDTCRSSCDPDELIDACTCCTIHDDSQPEPDLVAGVYAGSA